MTPIQIQKIRKGYKETQREFSARLGIHVETLRRWEQGRVSPSRMAVRMLEASR